MILFLVILFCYLIFLEHYREVLQINLDQNGQNKIFSYTVNWVLVTCSKKKKIGAWLPLKKKSRVKMSS